MWFGSLKSTSTDNANQNPKSTINDKVTTTHTNNTHKPHKHKLKLAILKPQYTQ